MANNLKKHINAEKDISHDDNTDDNYTDDLDNYDNSIDRPVDPAIEKLEQIKARLKQVSEVFTPSFPIEVRELFSGRIPQIDQAIAIKNLRGRHCIIFGDRGVGKTSFANQLKVIYAAPELQVIRVSCDSKDTFTSLWMKILENLVMITEVTTSTFGYKASSTTTIVPNLAINYVDPQLTQKHGISTSQILSILKEVNHAIIIIDEFDRQNSQNFDMRLFSDLIKSISDSLPLIKIIIVGVAENVTSLIGNHESITRNLSQIHLPVMSFEEIKGIIINGEEFLTIKFDEPVIAKIVELSSGFPYFTHSLCYYAACYAVQNEQDVIKDEHFIKAAIQTIDNCEESLRDSYRIATLATKSNMFKAVLYAASIVKNDEFGYFLASDVASQLTKILEKNIAVSGFIYHIDKLCKDERGSILKTSGTTNRHKYKFRNPLMRAFIRLKGEKDGISSYKPVIGNEPLKA